MPLSAVTTIMVLSELLDDIEAKWLKKHKPKNPNSFTEQLQLRTQTRMMAEEIVIMDVVMQFH